MRDSEMDYIVVGLNHQSAPLELREKLCFDAGNLAPTLNKLLQVKNVTEGLILSTCNRVEIYAATPDGNRGVENIKDFLVCEQKLDPKIVFPHLYTHQSLAAVKHLFRVTASLDSMILGEPQIAGQVKDAFNQALRSKSSGEYLNRFVSRALFVAKKVRTETAISEHAVSVGSAAVDLAKKIFGDLKTKKVVLIGAGEMGEQVLKSLMNQGVTAITLVNRSLERAHELAKSVLPSAKVCGLGELGQALQDVDVVITSVGSSDFILSCDDVSKVLSERKGHSLFLIDLGVPRNVEPRVNDLGNAYLYNVDDLQKIVDSNCGKRLFEAKFAEEIVAKEASEFYDFMVQGAPTIHSLGRKFENIRRGELDRTFKKMGHLSDGDKENIERMTTAIVSRILYDPILALKSDEMAEEDWDAYHILKKLFKLD